MRGIAADAAEIRQFLPAEHAPAWRASAVKQALLGGGEPHRARRRRRQLLALRVVGEAAEPDRLQQWRRGIGGRCPAQHVGDPQHQTRAARTASAGSRRRRAPARRFGRPAPPSRSTAGWARRAPPSAPRSGRGRFPPGIITSSTIRSKARPSSFARASAGVGRGRDDEAVVAQGICRNSSRRRAFVVDDQDYGVQYRASRSRNGRAR